MGRQLEHLSHVGAQPIVCDEDHAVGAAQVDRTLWRSCNACSKRYRVALDSTHVPEEAFSNCVLSAAHALSADLGLLLFLTY